MPDAFLKNNLSIVISFVVAVFTAGGIFAEFTALKDEISLVHDRLDEKIVFINKLEERILNIEKQVEYERGLLEAMSKSNVKKLESEINRTIVEDNPEAIIITSPGILNLTKTFSDRFNIPIVEGVSAAATLLETLSKQNLKIKKVSSTPNKKYGIPI